MTRSQLQTVLFPQTRSLAIMSAMGLAAIVAALILFGGAALYTLFREIRADGFEWSVPATLSGTGVATGLLAVLLRRVKRSYSATLEARWTVHYAGTRWRTPAGEVVDFVKSNSHGSSLAVRFSNGDVQIWDIGDLFSLDGLDVTSVNPVARSSSRIMTGVRGAALCASFFGFAILFKDSSFLLYTVATAVWFGAYVGELHYDFRDDIYVDCYNPLLHRVSVCDWKTLDGEVGKVRWADRQSGDTQYHTDYLTLVFPDGSKKRFERPDLVPMGNEGIA